MYRKTKRKVPEINSSSTADIAFLLLIFFLMSTSMDTDKGLPRRLPELPAEGQTAEPTKLKERNLLPVDLTGTDAVLCGGDTVDLTELRRRAKEFIANPSDREDLPEKEPVEIPYFGLMPVTKHHLIYLRCDSNASYQAYMAVQNELAAAYNELRDDLARLKWQKNYAGLTPGQKQAVRQVYPQRISETGLEKQGGNE